MNRKKLANKKTFAILSLLAFIFCISESFADIKDNVIGTPNEIYKVKKGNTLYKIATKHDLSIAAIMQANPEITDREIINYNQEINLPTAHILPNYSHEGIVINLAEMRLYYYYDPNQEVNIKPIDATSLENAIEPNMSTIDNLASESVQIKNSLNLLVSPELTNSIQIKTFPIAIGKEGSETPLGKTYIARKRANPDWVPPQSLKEENPNLPDIVPAGPTNPLGAFALDLSWPKFLIHGTNDPMSIGNRESHGCIRLYPKDIADLFATTNINIPVRIVNQPIKVGKLNNRIYIEVHLAKEEDMDLAFEKAQTLICRYISDCEARVDVTKIQTAILENKGVPVEITFLKGFGPFKWVVN